ncbi:cellulose 1,4-beta-cellobiosidase [Aureococcus anophagefferens]|nr:cellulose 1,4-beta-cellobiosidase [Aureococcus anophagefferens]
MGDAGEVARRAPVSYNDSAFLLVRPQGDGAPGKGKGAKQGGRRLAGIFDPVETTDAARAIALSPCDHVATARACGAVVVRDGGTGDHCAVHDEVDDADDDLGSEGGEGAGGQAPQGDESRDDDAFGGPMRGSDARKVLAALASVTRSLQRTYVELGGRDEPSRMIMTNLSGLVDDPPRASMQNMCRTSGFLDDLKAVLAVLGRAILDNRECEAHFGVGSVLIRQGEALRALQVQGDAFEPAHRSPWLVLKAAILREVADKRHWSKAKRHAAWRKGTSRSSTGPCPSSTWCRCRRATASARAALATLFISEETLTNAVVANAALVRKFCEFILQVHGPRAEFLEVLAALCTVDGKGGRSRSMLRMQEICGTLLFNTEIAGQAADLADHLLLAISPSDLRDNRAPSLPKEVHLSWNADSKEYRVEAVDELFYDAYSPKLFFRDGLKEVLWPGAPRHAERGRPSRSTRSGQLQPVKKVAPCLRSETLNLLNNLYLDRWPHARVAAPALLWVLEDVDRHLATSATLNPENVASNDLTAKVVDIASALFDFGLFTVGTVDDTIDLARRLVDLANPAIDAPAVDKSHLKPVARAKARALRGLAQINDATMHWRIERILSYLFEEMGDRTFDVHKFPNVDPDRPNLGDILRTCYGKVIGALGGAPVRGRQHVQRAGRAGLRGRGLRPAGPSEGVLSGLLISDDDTLFEAALSALVDTHSVHGSSSAIERGTFLKTSKGLPVFGKLDTLKGLVINLRSAIDTASTWIKEHTSAAPASPASVDGSSSGRRAPSPVGGVPPPVARDKKAANVLTTVTNALFWVEIFVYFDEDEDRKEAMPAECNIVLDGGADYDGGSGASTIDMVVATSPPPSWLPDWFLDRTNRPSHEAPLGERAPPADRALIRLICSYAHQGARELCEGGEHSCIEDALFENQDLGAIERFRRIATASSTSPAKAAQTSAKAGASIASQDTRVALIQLLETVARDRAALSIRNVLPIPFLAKELITLDAHKTELSIRVQTILGNLLYHVFFATGEPELVLFTETLRSLLLNDEPPEAEGLQRLQASLLVLKTFAEAVTAQEKARREAGAGA